MAVDDGGGEVRRTNSAIQLGEENQLPTLRPIEHDDDTTCVYFFRVYSNATYIAQLKRVLSADVV
jgi:hypothetical protein